MKNLPAILSVPVFLLLLAGCGGGGSDRPQVLGNGIFPEEDNESEEDGFLLDSGVAGMQYQSGAMTGTTDADGGFSYVPGQPVIFRIHDIDVMTVMPESVTTPVDAAESGQANDQQAVNIARFLQSLDSDNDVENGIQLNVAENSTNNVVIDFDVPTSEFTNGAGAQFVNGQGKALKSSDAALQHLQQTIAFFDNEDGITLEPVVFELPAGESQTITISAANNVGSVNFRSSDSNVMAETNSARNQFVVSALTTATPGRVTVEADLQFDGGSTATKAVVVRITAATNSDNPDMCTAGDQACDPDACPTDMPPPCDGIDPMDPGACMAGDMTCDPDACPADMSPPCDNTGPMDPDPMNSDPMDPDPMDPGTMNPGTSDPGDPGSCMPGDAACDPAGGPGTGDPADPGSPGVPAP